jgi:hypothetical protein
MLALLYFAVSCVALEIPCRTGLNTMDIACDRVRQYFSDTRSMGLIAISTLASELE